MGKKDVYIFPTVFNDPVCRDGDCNTYLISLEIHYNKIDQNENDANQLLKGMSGVSFNVRRKFLLVLSK